MKSRDMHWALVAHRDQRDINLSSLRMLIVADGANPCKWQLERASSCASRLQALLRLVPLLLVRRRLPWTTSHVTPCSLQPPWRVAGHRGPGLESWCFHVLIP